LRFWDSSALVALLIEEPFSSRARSLIEADPDVLLWSLSEVEIVSALWRRRRAGELDEKSRVAAQRYLDDLLPACATVTDIGLVVQRARRVLGLHVLRAADSLQLAAALIACDDRPELLPFVTVDDRLAEAAAREGFNVEAPAR
jgi:predicted nucleic acid-binding protein